MVFVFVRPLKIHEPRIPLATESGDRINAPMDKDSKFCVLVPLGNFVGLKRFPIGTKRTFAVCAIDVGENRRARTIIFRARFLPHLIDSLGSFLGGGSSRWRSLSEGQKRNAGEALDQPDRRSYRSGKQHGVIFLLRRHIQSQSQPVWTPKKNTPR